MIFGVVSNTTFIGDGCCRWTEGNTASKGELLNGSTSDGRIKKETKGKGPS